MTRVETGIGELDRVLGGGIVPGALISGYGSRDSWGNLTEPFFDGQIEEIMAIARRQYGG